MAAGRTVRIDRIDSELLGFVADIDAAPPIIDQPRRNGAHETGEGLISPREREVLLLVAEGRSNKQIADALFIAPTTAKFHVTSLLNKLGADKRAQLVAMAAQRGMLPLGSAAIRWTATPSGSRP